MTTKKKSTDLTRRDLLRRSAIGAATVGGVSAGAIRLDHGPVGNSEAIAPAVVAGGIAAGAGASAAVGWAIREYEIVGSDDPPAGQTADGLRNETYNRVRDRISYNDSNFVNNLSILEGVEHTAWANAKFAAIEQLNEQASQDDVDDAAHASVDEEESRVKRNLMKAWDEMIEFFLTMRHAADEHPDLEHGDLFVNAEPTDGGGQNSNTRDFIYDGDDNTQLEATEKQTHTLPNGEEYDYSAVAANRWDGTDWLTPFGTDASRHAVATSWTSDEDALYFIRSNDWEDLMNEVEQTFQQIRDSISVWVDGVYSDVQAGDLDTGELLTPREQAELTTEDEDFPQAIADLQALNVATDLEREAEIYLPEIDATLYGQLGFTGDGTLETGSVNPDNEDGSIYLTYDVSQGEGEWSAYDEGIDGGTLTFTQEPFVESLYVVDTTAGETVELTADDFEHDAEADEWTVDLSDDLDDAITNVEQIQFFSEVETTQFETIRLRDQFEIIAFEDSEGNTHESADFDRSEPHDDTNYITEEEWQDQQERQEELIEKYEDAQSGGGITIGGTSIPNELIGLGLAVAAAFGLLR